MTFIPICTAIGKMFLIVSVGFFMYSKGILKEKWLNIASTLLVWVFFPSLIIYKTILGFSFSAFPLWWLLPLWSAGYSIFGIILGYLALKLSGIKASKDEFACSVGFQNAGYLPITLVYFLFSGDRMEIMLVSIFLFIVGFNVLMWTFTPVLLSLKNNKKIKLSHVLNAPVLAIVFSFLWVIFFGTNNVPLIIKMPLKFLSNISFYVAMIVLGGFLAKHKGYSPKNKSSVFFGVFLKLVLFPATMLFWILSLNVSGDMQTLLFIEAIMPTAVSMVVIGAFTGADTNYFSSVVFYSHILAVLTMPVWLLIFSYLS